MARLLLALCVLVSTCALAHGDYTAAVLQIPKARAGPNDTVIDVKQTNLDLIEEYAAMAAKAGAQILVTPELSVGWCVFV